MEVEESLADLSVAMVSIVITICDTLIRSGAVDREYLLENLHELSLNEVISELNPLGQAAVNGVILALEISEAGDGNPSTGH